MGADMDSRAGHEHAPGADDPTVTIAICTRDRAAMLARTLERIQAARHELDIATECVVVDNGSSDNTRHVVEHAGQSCLGVRWVREARKGVARARNAALRAARGRIIAFADDDVSPAKGWLSELILPILNGEADAVAGAIRLAAHLMRPWMEPWHRAWLGETLSTNSERPVEMYGANMAIGRHVLERVPAFDPELGVGALGHGEEALYSYQVRAAGLRIVRAEKAVVEHDADAEHLCRRSLLADSVSRGRTLAYMHYHWGHAEVAHARKKAAVAELRLIMARAALWGLRRSADGLPQWEMQLVRHIAYLRQFAAEIRRPRNYDRHGLVKLRGVMP